MTIPDAAYFAANQWRRLSAKQVDLFLRCPARWGYRYLDWHQEPRTAVMFAGVAVQDAVEDVLRMSLPDTFTTDVGLFEWSVKQAAIRFGIRWAEQMAAFGASPGVVGGWDLDAQRFCTYAIHGARMHSGMVPQFWDEHMSLSEAWEAARPEMPGSDLRVIPEGWYQWAADLICTMPDGSRVLVDMKVGRGGDWIPKYEDQMRQYLWADGLSRPGETPAKGMLWLLGAETVVHEVAPWADDARQDFLSTCVKMIECGDPDAQPWTRYGWHGAAPGYQECSRCPFREACPSRAKDARYTVPVAAPVGADGFVFGEIGGMSTGYRVRFGARVIGIGDPKEKRGKRTCRVTLANASGMRSYSWDAHHVERLGLRVGQVVSLSGLRTWAPPEGRATMLFADQYTEASS